VYVLRVVELDSIFESLVGKREKKGEKKQIMIFVLKRKMQGDLFIPES
jgi:hypothetical protein